MKIPVDSNTLVTCKISSRQMGIVMGMCLKHCVEDDQFSVILLQSGVQMAAGGVIELNPEGIKELEPDKAVDFTCPLWAILKVSQMLGIASVKEPLLGFHAISAWAPFVKKGHALVNGEDEKDNTQSFGDYSMN